MKKSGKTGHKKIYEIKTRNRTLRATDNHPILVRRKKKEEAPKIDNRMSKEFIYSLEYVQVKDLVKNDVVVQVHNLPDLEVNIDNITIEDMEFFGFYLGDGYTSYPVRLYLTFQDTHTSHP